MIKVYKQQNKPSLIIRPASERELVNYEKNKLIRAEKQLRVNKPISNQVNSDCIQVTAKSTLTKTSDLAFKNAVISGNTSTNGLLFIRCLSEWSGLNK